MLKGIPLNAIGGSYELPGIQVIYVQVTYMLPVHKLRREKNAMINK